jgi:8-oxo-dGTP diphosphatase
MGAMKPVKHSVAVVVREAGSPAGGAFLVVRRPEDPEDPLAGVWGLPAVTLLDGEDERAAVVRAGRVKLGVELTAGARIGEKTSDRGGYLLRLADYEAAVIRGVPAVPQPDGSMTQYTACRYTTDPGTLAEAAARGSLCAQVFLDAGGEPGAR